MIVLLMGVSGSGKTTVGRLLAETLGWEFYDADDLHSRPNLQKMRRGVPFTDSDRLPWLHRVPNLIDRCIARGIDAVVACSALKRSYRAVIVPDRRHVSIVHLKGSRQLIARRLSGRMGHFMPPSLLGSQFQALEEPREALTVNVRGTPHDAVEVIRQKLGI